MAYVEGQTIHDADSHIMELPGTINRYVDPKFRDAFVAKAGAKAQSAHWSEKFEAKHDDPEFQAGAEANILLRKNYEALGAFPVSDIIAVRDRIAARGADGVHDFARGARRSAGAVRLGTEIVHDDLRSLAGEFERVASADSPARAGDDDDPSFTDSAHGHLKSGARLMAH